MIKVHLFQSPSDSSRICFWHLQDDDLIVDSSGKLRQYRKSSSKSLQKRYIKPNAVETVWPSCPSCSSKNISSRTTILASSEAHLLKEYNDNTSLVNEFFKKEQIYSINELFFKIA